MKNKKGSKNNMNNNNQSQDNQRQIHWPFDMSHFPSTSIVPQLSSHGGYAEEIAYNATQCLSWWRAGVKSVELISSLIGLDCGQVVLYLLGNCGVSESELGKQVWKT